jgi:hypothetical protein
MSYIPDTRQKYGVPTQFSSADPDTPNGYFEGLLTGRDADFIQGYDWAADQISNLPYNFEIYARETFSEYFSRKQIEKIAKLLKPVLEEWLEMARDEIVVSMIDNMDDEEYKKAYIRIFGEKAYNKEIKGE